MFFRNKRNLVLVISFIIAAVLTSGIYYLATLPEREEIKGYVYFARTDIQKNEPFRIADFERKEVATRYFPAAAQINPEGLFLLGDISTGTLLLASQLGEEIFWEFAADEVLVAIPAGDIHGIVATMYAGDVITIVEHGQIAVSDEHTDVVRFIGGTQVLIPQAIVVSVSDELVLKVTKEESLRLIQSLETNRLHFIKSPEKGTFVYGK